MKIKKISQSAGVIADVVNSLDSNSAINALSAAAGKELNRKKIGLPIQIPANSDLNNYSFRLEQAGPGLYFCNTIADAKTLLNCPTEKAFSLLVEKHAGSKQTLTTYDIDFPEIFIRNEYNNEWGPWKRIEGKNKIHAYYSNVDETTFTSNENQYILVPLDTVFYQYGSELNKTAENDAIVIGKYINNIRISASITCDLSKLASDKIIGVLVIKNNYDLTYQTLQACHTDNWQRVTFNGIMSVQENDKIFLAIRTVASPGTTLDIHPGRFNTNIIIEEI